MAEVKTVTELDLGNTLLIKGSKVHVNIDGATIVAENGVLKAVLPSDSPITSFELSQPATLKLGVRGVDQPFTVDLSNIVPNTTADRFLSGVTYDNMAKAFVFTTSKDGEDDNEFRVPLADFLRVSQAEGNILELREDGFYVPCCNKGGSDNLENIPEKPFENGSKILAFDQNGELYQFAQNSTYEKDVAVNIEVVSNEVKEDGTNIANVVVTVSNNLKTTADNIQLNVGTAATITSGEASPEKFTLAGNSQQAFAYTVTYNTSGFVTATVNALGDAVSSNNTATVALPFKVKQKPVSADNEFTDECPLINATYNGEALLASKQVGTLTGLSPYEFAANIIADTTKPNLNGVTINVKGASRVVVKTTEGNSRGKGLGGYASGTFAILKQSDTVYKSFGVDFGGFVGDTDKYTFNVASGDLTFTNDFNRDTAVIFLRPGGENCKWQVYAVVCTGATATITEEDKKLATSGLPDDVVEYEVVKQVYNLFHTDRNGIQKTFDELDAFVPTENQKIIGNLTGAKITERAYLNYERPMLVDSTRITEKRLVVKLCSSNLPVTFDVKSMTPLTFTQGNVGVSRKGGDVYTVTVQNGATKTDNYTTEPFKLILGECSNVVSGGSYDLTVPQGTGGIGNHVPEIDEDNYE